MFHMEFLSNTNGILMVDSMTDELQKKTSHHLVFLNITLLNFSGRKMNQYINKGVWFNMVMHGKNTPTLCWRIIFLPLEKSKQSKESILSLHPRKFWSITQHNVDLKFWEKPSHPSLKTSVVTNALKSKSGFLTVPSDQAKLW